MISFKNPLTCSLCLHQFNVVALLNNSLKSEINNLHLQSPFLVAGLEKETVVMMMAKSWNQGHFERGNCSKEENARNNLVLNTRTGGLRRCKTNM